MDNSLTSDEIKPLELTAEQCSELQILLNKLWNLQTFTDEFNLNINRLFDNFKYVLKNIDPTIVDKSYFNHLEEKTEDFKKNLLTSKDDYQKKVNYYLDILKTHRFMNSWEDEWIKKIIPEKNYPKLILDQLNNYFSNISSFNLPCCLVLGKSETFLEYVMGSEPIFLYYRENEEPRVQKTLSNLNEVQRSRIRLYTNNWDIPKGLMANIIAWDYVHLINTEDFEKNVIGFLYSLLRPGGLLTFNYPSVYNHQDFDLIVRHLFGAYDPFFLETVLTKTGFEVIKHDLDNQIFYVKKPGILNSNKASPTISTIVNIDSILGIK